jgi:hypothetical protein
MSKKDTKSSGGKLTSIKGGKSAGISSGESTHGSHDSHNSHDHDADEGFPNGNTVGTGPVGTPPNKVIDFSSVRAQRNLDNRRNFERFFLQHMIDVYCEVDGNQKMPIEIVEISESGCSFRLSTERAKNLPRDTKGELIPVHVRFYFSKESYLRVGFFAVNSTRDIANGTQSVRFGCKVDESFASTEAYRQFARFMEGLAKHALRDTKQVSGY